MDLSCAVLPYPGAAAVVGQSYLGALLCSADGRWPEAARSGAEYERIRAAFAKCGLELWELYGHGPAEGGASFMWTEAHAAWERSNPPPLAPIGDQSVQVRGSGAKARVRARVRVRVRVGVRVTLTLTLSLSRAGVAQEREGEAGSPGGVSSAATAPRRRRRPNQHASRSKARR